MIKLLGASDFLEKSHRCLLADVRSPGEFSAGHIPGAINIPLFSDEERAVIGTLYARQGSGPAILKGLDFALPKVFSFSEELKIAGRSNTVCLHCWRGGLRSEMMAAVFSKAGYRVFVLEGGYKAYRRFIRENLSRLAMIMVLGGYTGCGKTDILKALSEAGEQVIDLEKLASHKGSVFGALGQGTQPTNEQFENTLYSIWTGLDPGRRIWLEDESRSIGKVALPPPVFEHISGGILIQVTLPSVIRINRLVAEYAGFGSELLGEALLRIREGIGGTRYKLALKSLEEKDFRNFAAIVLEYYDKAYMKAIDKRPAKKILRIELKGSDPRLHAKAILKMLKNHPDESGLSRL